MAGPLRDRRDSFFPERLEEFVGRRFVAFDEGVDGIMDWAVVSLCINRITDSEAARNVAPLNNANLKLCIRLCMR